MNTSGTTLSTSRSFSAAVIPSRYGICISIKTISYAGLYPSKNFTALSNSVTVKLLSFSRL